MKNKTLQIAWVVGIKKTKEAARGVSICSFFSYCVLVMTSKSRAIVETYCMGKGWGISGRE
jgi:hypothetical protein